MPVKKRSKKKKKNILAGDKFGLGNKFDNFRRREMKE